MSSVSSASASHLRDYGAAISQEDQEGIRFVITTLANASFVKICAQETQLREVGDRATKHVHPLNYLKFVLANPDLKRDFRKMDGAMWSLTKKGFCKSLTQARMNRNLGTEIVKDFTSSLDLDHEVVVKFFPKDDTEKKHDWQPFMSYMHNKA